MSIRIFLISCLVILTGCARTISSNTIEEAMDSCKNNGGVHSVVVDSKNIEEYFFEEIRCNDGYILPLINNQKVGVKK